MASKSFIQVILKALATSMSARVFGMALRFVTIFLLPIWLIPSEVGWSAVILATVNLLVAISDLGFGTALVKQKDCADRMFNSVNSLVMIAGVSLMVLLCACSGAVSAFSHVPATLFIIVSFAIPLCSAAIVPNAILNRDLRFTSLAIRDCLGEIVFSGTAIALAVLDYGVYCVPVAIVAQRFVRLVVSFIAVNWHPKFVLNKEDISVLKSFSMYQLGNISVAQIANRLDTFLLSYFVPSASLGVYSQAQQLSLQPIEALSATARSVFFSSFAKIQGEEKQFHALFVKIVGALIALSGLAIMVMYPIMGIIPYIYNEAWVDSVGIARILCFSVPFYAAVSLEGVLITIGGEKRRLLATVTRALMMATGICVLFAGFPEYATTQHIAWLVLVCASVGVALNFSFLVKRLKITWRDVKKWMIIAIPSIILAAASVIISELYL